MTAAISISNISTISTITCWVFSLDKNFPSREKLLQTQGIQERWNTPFSEEVL